MKCYDADFIFDFIQKNEDKIKSVYVGMDEDWKWTSKKIYGVNGFEINKPKDNKLYIQGIYDSVWATPVMRVEYFDGTEETIPAWYEDGKAVGMDKVEAKKRLIKLLNLIGKDD